ncbi:hypothetical protein LDENG_00260950 [Lucifuga dentata]|nr:hypothetical protein LDENG_00260950 [Lucifuga dentata]
MKMSHPGQSSTVGLIIQNPEVGPAIIQHQLLAIRWRNVTSSLWKCPVNGQC